MVYCFNGMMNLRYTDPSVFDDLVDRTMSALLVPNAASHTVPGTGPYPVVGKILWADMASIAFVVPPLIEAFALYLQFRR